MHAANFDATDLIPGKYKATFTAPGFETAVLNGIVLNGSDVVQSECRASPGIAYCRCSGNV